MPSRPPRGADLRDSRPTSDGFVLLGEDWVAPTQTDTDLSARRRKRGIFSVNRSPLARKIIIFNLLGLIILLAGVLYLNPGRDSLVKQRASAFISQANLVADVFEARLPAIGPVNLASGDGIDARAVMSGLDLPPGVDLFVFDPAARMVASSEGLDRRAPGPEGSGSETTIITNFLNRVWTTMSSLLGAPPQAERLPPVAVGRKMAPRAMTGQTAFETGRDAAGNTIFTVATPIMRDDQVLGVITMSSAAGEIDSLVRSEREQVLRMFVVAILVSVGLSLVLAGTIANPLSDLGRGGRDRPRQERPQDEPGPRPHSGSDRAP